MHVNELIKECRAKARENKKKADWSSKCVSGLTITVSSFLCLNILQSAPKFDKKVPQCNALWGFFFGEFSVFTVFIDFFS